MAKNTKTPVMVLTELAVKKGFPSPEFILVRAKTNTHENEYTYSLTIQGIVAIGSGTSKKDAKQITAYQALQQLNNIGIVHPDYESLHDPQQRIQELPSPKKQRVNCIVKLSELCLDSNVPEPVYEEISDVGPPHCKEFTYDCILSSIRTRATAGTKKQAKQLAAQEMLERIKGILDNPEADLKSALTEKEEINIKYEDMYGIKRNYNISLQDLCPTLMDALKDKYPTRASVSHILDGPKTLENLELLLSSVDLSHKLQIISLNPNIVAINVCADSPVTTLGMDGTHVEIAISNALTMMFELINTFLY